MSGIFYRAGLGYIYLSTRRKAGALAISKILFWDWKNQEAKHWNSCRCSCKNQYTCPMTNTDKLLHLASQFLAMAGKNYAVHVEDDSHTNVGWRKDKSTYVSRRLNNDSFLELNTVDFQLEWKHKKLALEGKRRDTVLAWLNECAQGFGYEGFAFEPHYEIPYQNLSEDFILEGFDQERSAVLAALRTNALESCIQAMKVTKVNAEIRVWPHHFDTGGYVELEEKGIGIGFGMAIPDSTVDDYYMYVSGYRGHEGIDTSNFTPLDNARWLNADFKGAVMPTTGNLKNTLAFLISGINTFKRS